MKPIYKTYIILLLCLASASISAKNIFVKSTAGATPYKKLENAIKSANTGDVIIVNIDIPFNAGDKTITITKGITIRGANRPNDRYKLIRKAINGNRNNGNILVIRSSNVTIKNINLVIYNGTGYKAIDVGLPANRKVVYSNLKFIGCNFVQKNATDTARGLFFEGSFKNVLVKNCKFNFWFGLVARDCPTLDNFKITECEFSNGSHQISFDGALLGENDPTYGIGERLTKHSNIIIEKSKFKISKSFNIALANTHNVIIRNNTQIDGGTESYSQPIHIEDRCKNISITGNKMKSKQAAILLFSTGKVGHGQGRNFTEAEKKAKGSGNVTITNNSIDAELDAVSVTYLNGYLTFKGNNIITSRKKALNVRKSNANTSLKIANETRMKGKLYLDIKKEPLKIKRDIYYVSDIKPE